MKVILTALLLVILPVAGCTGSEGGAGEVLGTSAESTFTEATLASAAEAGESARGEAPNRPDVVLRVEGGRGTRFSGICAAGEEETIIKGEVPKRFVYDGLEGLPFSCRIQKRDEGSGNLKVILISRGVTRSVQQTDARDDTIRVSHESG